MRICVCDDRDHPIKWFRTMYAQSTPTTGQTDSDAPICAIHNRPKHSRRLGPNRPQWWSCSACNAQSSRRNRERHRGRRLNRQVQRIWRAEAQRAVELADALVRYFGGRDRLLALLKPDQAAQIAGKLIMARAELETRSDDAERREKSAAKASADDPAVVCTCIRIVAELPPSKLRHILERLKLRSRDRRASVMDGYGEGI